jgi:hypothetical protein
MSENKEISAHVKIHSFDDKYVTIPAYYFRNSEKLTKLCKSVYGEGIIHIINESNLSTQLRKGSYSVVLLEFTAPCSFDALSEFASSLYLSDLASAVYLNIKKKVPVDIYLTLINLYREIFDHNLTIPEYFTC